MGKVVSARCFSEQATCNVIGAEVDRVTLHELISLYGGQHGINPAETATPLSFTGVVLRHISVVNGLCFVVC